MKYPQDYPIKGECRLCKAAKQDRAKKKKSESRKDSTDGKGTLQKAQAPDAR